MKGQFHSRLLTLFALAGLSVGHSWSPTTATEISGQTRFLDRLVSEHPRLILDDAGLEALRERIRNDPHLQRWTSQLRHEAQRILDDPLPAYDIPDGLRLLATSKRVVRNVYTLALLYRLDEDRRYLTRLWRELDAVTQFPDWNPKHFLDTAEMTHACAIAYDWLYRDWSEEQRAILRAAIVRHGLIAGLQCYTGEDPRNWWCTTEFNWNQVCNGGLLTGAIAVAEDEPELAEQILQHVLQSLPLAMREFSPDGACREGPSYWGYACDYTTIALASLESAFRTDFGLSNYPGLERTANYLPQMTGPSGAFFNFADCPEESRWSTAPMFWLANRYQLGNVCQSAIKNSRGAPLDVIWFRAPQSVLPDLEKVSCWRGAEACSMRTGWGPTDTWVAFKAGRASINHAQCDLGSFVFEAKGQRWAIDLGRDNYNLPGYFDPAKRWNYYRNRAEGHNTLVVNANEHPDQLPEAATKIGRWSDAQDFCFGTMNLSAAYARQALTIQRGIGLAANHSITVQDELVPSKTASVKWSMHTRSHIRLENHCRVAVLTQQSETIFAHLLTPTKARFSVRDAVPAPSSPHPAGQDTNHDVTVLEVELVVDEPTTLAVRFQIKDDIDHASTDATVTPLIDW